MDEMTERIQYYHNILNDATKSIETLVAGDRTLCCRITEVLDSTSNTYRAQYMNNKTLTVYGSDNALYAIGENVYVLVPEGDFNNQKIIIGKQNSNVTATGQKLYAMPSDRYLRAADFKAPETVQEQDKKYIKYTMPQYSVTVIEADGDDTSTITKIYNYNYNFDNQGRPNYLVFKHKFAHNTEYSNADYGYNIAITYEDSSVQTFSFDQTQFFGNVYSGILTEKQFSLPLAKTSAVKEVTCTPFGQLKSIDADPELYLAYDKEVFAASTAEVSIISNEDVELVYNAATAFDIHAKILYNHNILSSADQFTDNQYLKWFQYVPGYSSTEEEIATAGHNWKEIADSTNIFEQRITANPDLTSTNIKAVFYSYDDEIKYTVLAESTIIFDNTDRVTDKATAEAVLSGDSRVYIKINDVINANMFVYGYDQKAVGGTTFQAKVCFKDGRKFTNGATITWSVPGEDSLLLPWKDETSKENEYTFSGTYEPDKEESDNITVSFSDTYYDRSSNTLRCTVVQDGETYCASLLLNFGYANSAGTSYSFNLEPSGECLVVGKDLTITAHFRDNKGYLVDVWPKRIFNFSDDLKLTDVSETETYDGIEFKAKGILYTSLVVHPNGTGINNPYITYGETAGWVYEQSDEKWVDTDYQTIEIITITDEFKAWLEGKGSYVRSANASLLHGGDNFIILEQSGNKFTLSTNSEKNINDYNGKTILQVTVPNFDINGQKIDFVAYWPVAVANVNNLNFKGCKRVNYDQNGANPKYDLIPYGFVNDVLTKAEMGNVSGSTEVELSSDNILVPARNMGNGITVAPIKLTSSNGRIWKQPVLITQNQYSSGLLNAWNGTSIESDNENATILATMFGAGKKNDQNQFSGVVFGDLQKATQASYTGLVGFQSGARRFELNENGEFYVGTGDDQHISLDKDGQMSIAAKSFVLNTSTLKINSKATGDQAFLSYYVEGTDTTDKDSNGNKNNPSISLNADGSANFTGVISAMKGSSIAGWKTDGNSIFKGKWWPGNWMTNGEWNKQYLATGLIFMCTGSTNSSIIPLGGDDSTTDRGFNWVFGCAPNFGIKKDGRVYASNVILTGSITATKLVAQGVKSKYEGGTSAPEENRLYVVGNMFFQRSTSDAGSLVFDLGVASAAGKATQTYIHFTKEGIRKVSQHYSGGNNEGYSFQELSWFKFFESEENNLTKYPDNGYRAGAYYFSEYTARSEGQPK